MHAVDTNVVLRFLAGDDPAQSKLARAIIGGQPVFVSRTVLLEVEWVLRSVYGLPAERIVASLRGIAGLPNVTVEEAPMVAKAFGWAAAGMDFADALHLAAAAACDGLWTFDRRFVRSASRAGGVPVTMP